MKIEDAMWIVAKFHLLSGQEPPTKEPLPETVELRCRLSEEELEEFFDAGTREEQLDAICDRLFVLLGDAVAYGFKPESVAEAFFRVCEANMKKFGEGGHKREDGKWIKPPDWKAPDLKDLI